MPRTIRIARSNRENDGLERRVRRLERIVRALNEEAGVSAYDCPQCDGGVVVSRDDWMSCDNCSYRRST